MKEINLLPPALRGESRLWRRSVWALGIGGACLLAALFFYGRWRIGVLEDELEALRLDRQLHAPTAARMREAEAFAARTARQEAALVMRTRASISPYAVLVQLGAAAERVWLEEVVLSESGEAIARGRALSYADANAFVDKLAQGNLFVEPALADWQSAADEAGVRFEIRMRCRGAEP